MRTVAGIYLSEMFDNRVSVVQLFAAFEHARMRTDEMYGADLVTMASRLPQCEMVKRWTMSELMKGAIVREFGAPLRIEEIRIPTPGPGQILVKVAACGVCHTDLHAASGDWPAR